MAGIDRRMSGGVDHLLEVATRNAQEQEQAQQKKIFSLQQAMNNPDAILQVKVGAVAIRNEGDQKFLCLATPDGIRQDFPISPQIEGMLRKALTAEVEEAA